MQNLRILIFLAIAIHCIVRSKISVAPLKELTELTLFPNETTRIDLNEYFVGYKLNVSLDSNTFKNASVTKPFEVESSIAFDFLFKTFVADEEETFLYTLDLKNTFRLFLKQNSYPTNILIGTAIDLSSGKQPGSISCQTVIKAANPSASDIFYFIVDCDWQNKSSFQVIKYNSSESNPQSTLTLQAKDQLFPSNFTNFQCNRTWLANNTLLYRYCPTSQNQQTPISNNMHPTYRESDAPYSALIEIYFLNASVPKISLVKTIGAKDMSLKSIQIESMIFWDQQLIIVDNGYGIYFIWNNNFIFSLIASHETYSETNRLMDYRFETRGTFPENNLLLLIRTDNYLSQLTIDRSQIIGVKNYNLNFDSVAIDANILENFIAVKATSDTVKSDQFLKIYKRDNPVILFDLQDINTNSSDPQVGLMDASEFFKTQDKIFILYNESNRYVLKICQIQSVFLEIKATIDVSSFTNAPPYAISVSSVSENTGLPFYSYNATISVSVIPSKIPTVYPEKQLKITSVTSSSDFKYPLAGTCKGPAMLYGWLVQPIKPDLQNINIKDTISFKANLLINNLSSSISDLTNHTFISYDFSEIDSLENTRLLSIVWQQCESCYIYLISCWFSEKFQGNIAFDNCTMTGNFSNGSVLNSLLVQEPYVYVTFKNAKQRLDVYLKSDLTLVAHGITDDCDNIELKPSKRGHVYCFCHKNGSINILKIKGANYTMLKNFSSLAKNTTWIDTALLDDGLIVTRNQSHVFIDILWKKDANSDSILTIHASSLKVYDSTTQGNFMIFITKLRADTRLIIIDTKRNKITEYSLFNPFQIRYRREYPLYDFFLTTRQPLLVSGNNFLVITANSSDLQAQYYLLYDPSKDSGSVLLYFDVISQSTFNLDLNNIFIPVHKEPVILALSREGLQVSLIERNPYVYGSFNLDQPSSIIDPFISGSFAIKCVSFSYNLRKSPYFKEGSYHVHSTLQLQDTKVFLQKISTNLTQFNFTNNKTQYQPIVHDYFTGPIEQYILNCSLPPSDCPYALKDFLDLNYEYTTYLNSTKIYGAPLQIRAINNTWVVLLSEYRISFISIEDGMEEMNSYDLRIFSLQCKQFYEAKEISSILVVCQKGTLSVNFLVFCMLDDSIKSGKKLTPKLVELPPGVRYSKISRLTVFEDLVLVLARQDANLNSNSIDVFRISKPSNTSYKFCLVKQIRLNKYRKAGDINIDHFYAQKFDLIDDGEGANHLMITLQQPNALLNLILNVTLYGGKYSNCSSSSSSDQVYSLVVWQLNPIDIPNIIIQYDAFEQNKSLNPYDSKTELSFVSIVNLNVNSSTSSLASCAFIIGTSQHTYIFDTALNFSDTNNLSSVSHISIVYRKYTRCQNIYAERPLLVQDSLIIFCVRPGPNTTHLLMYKNGQNCKVSDYNPNITECWPVQMIDMGYNATIYSTSRYFTSEMPGANNQHLLVSSYVSQFLDLNINQHLAIILKDNRLRTPKNKELRTQLTLEGRNFDRVTGGRATLTVANYIEPEVEDNSGDILGLIFYGLCLGCAIVLIYISIKIAKRAIDESQRDSNKDMYSFLGKSPRKIKRTPSLEYEFS